MFNDPSRMLDLSNYLYGLAAILTLFATFGVIYFGRVVSHLKDAQAQQYQKDADVKISEANRKGEEAQAGAAGANAVAATAKAHSDTAKADSERAKADAANARAQAASANAEAEKSKTERAALQLRIQELTRSNLEQGNQIGILTENSKPRIVTNAQMSMIVQYLRPIVATLSESSKGVEISIFSSENEPAEFAGQVAQALGSAGLKPRIGTIFGNQTATGAAILIDDKSAPPPLALAMAAAFGNAGVPIGVQPTPGLGQGGLSIIIGAKRRVSN